MTILWESLAGKVYWCPDAAMTSELEQKLQVHNFVRTADRWSADVFIVPDAADAPERVLWLATVNHAATKQRNRYTSTRRQPSATAIRQPDSNQAQPLYVTPAQILSSGGSQRQ